MDLGGEFRVLLDTFYHLVSLPHFYNEIHPTFATCDTPSVKCKIRPPNTMIYDVLKIAQNRLILYTPMKMSRWKGAIELPVRTFSAFVDFS